MVIQGWKRYFTQVCRLVDEARAGGALVEMGGAPDPAGPLFYKPTILTQEQYQQLQIK